MAFKFIILGSGSSMGTPNASGYAGNCDLKNKKNYRTRCSALITFNNENILIDTSPDLRHQLLSNKIKFISKVFYTHMHADQTHGINDLRPFFLINKKQIPLYADNLTSKYLYKTFKYCFKDMKGYPSTLFLNKLKKIHIFKSKNKKISIRSLKVKHGFIESTCYIIDNKLAYISDVNKIYKKDLPALKNLKFLVVDCFCYKEHPTHFNLDQVLQLVKLIKPRKTILTNMNSDLDYKTLKKILPKNIIPGFDGMTLNL